MANENNRLVLAYFPNRDAAEATAEDLMAWDSANDSIKLGAIAVLTLNPKTGEIEADEVGERTTKKGALWGTVIGATIGLLTGGIGLIPGLLLGAGGGAVIGSLNHKSVGLTDADRDRIVNHLRDGLAALAVMADDFEVDDTLRKMVELGGRAEAFEVPAETVTVLTAAAEVQKTAAAAVDEAVSVASDAAAGATKAVTVDLPGVPAAAAAAVAGLAAGIDISADDAVKLHDAGIAKASALFKQVSTPAGRANVVAKTGLSADAVLAMTKKMDLMRVKGVGPKYATLLLASGIDSVAELATRNPANLLAKMAEVNAVAQDVAALPSEADVTGWVAQAKALPKVVQY